MKQFKDMKLGDEVPKSKFGEFKDVFKGKTRLLKITYSIQDEDGTTVDVGLEHKDFYKEGGANVSGEENGNWR